jgi:ferredoxin
MTVVITERCVGTCDTACVSVCPVDAIHGPVDIRTIESVPREERALRFPTLQLFINPDECICCSACIPECPVDAIFLEDELPEDHRDSIERNAAFFRRAASP